MRILLLPLFFLFTFGVDVSIDGPPTISGNCDPTRVHFAAHITATGPSKITYVWLRGDKGSSAVETLEFRQAGPSPVSYDWLIRNRTSSWVSLKVLTPVTQQSRKVTFDVSCK